MSKGHYPTRVDPVNLPRRLREGLLEAEELLEQKKTVEAKIMLEELDKKFPHQFDVLGFLANACVDTKDSHGYLEAMLELHKLRPTSPDINLGLAGAYLNTGRLSLALQIFERFLDRWPGHPAAGDAQKTVQVLHKGLKEIIAELELPEEEGLEFARKHEELQVCLDAGRYQRGKSLAKELRERKPDFAPAFNNLSQIYWLEGNLPEAIQTCQQVLAFEPDNVHALGNIIRFLYLSGRRGEAPTYVERLKRSKAEAADRWKKIGETLSFIGDDEGMLSLRVRVLKEGGLEEIDENFYHFLATSEAMLGQESAAKSDWKHALKINPTFTLAQENTADLKRPKHERNGPWAYPLGQMLPEKVIRELTAVVERAAKSKNEAAFQPAVQRFLDAHPEILQLSPLILERGELVGKEFVINVADMSGHPEFLSLLKEFAFGQRGSDDLRMKAAQILSKHNAAPTGQAKIWLEGEWKEILLLGFEITPEPIMDDNPMRPKTIDLMARALDALRENDGARAEGFLRKALTIQPEHPSLLNNLALALSLQDKKKESEAILKHITEDFPDYFFGQISLARKALWKKDYKKARSIVDQWLEKKKRYHVTEFNALCKVQIDLLIQEDHYDAAISWFELWEGAEPDDVDFEDYKERIDLLKLLSRFKNRQRKNRKQKKE
ncbi:MAG: tetratricopeptide repeat protein [Chloroflexota bacterium]